MAAIAGVLRRALPAAGTIVGAAVLLRLAYHPWYLNFDARYALDWAHDIWHGLTPDYTAPYAPTPHPLSTALSSLALPFGDGGDQLILWLVLLAFGATVWLAYLLGAELFSQGVGVVLALVVLTRPALQRDAVLGYQDVWFEVVVLWAILLEVRRPRRGVPVLVLLAVAGLLRPDAWVLSGLYFLWLWPATPETRRRIGLAALVCVGPVVWLLVDLAVTGDALHSLHGTAHLADVAGRRRHITQAPRWTAQYLAFVLREPVLAGLPIGLWFAWKYRRRESALPIAAAVAILLAFAAGPIFGLPLIGRYVRTPAILLALFYGLAVLGWRLLPAGEARRRWMWAGVLAALFSVAYLPWHVKKLHGLRTSTISNGRLYSDLRKASRAPAVRSAFAACGERISTSDHRPIPYVRYWLHSGPGSVGTIEKRATPLAHLLLTPRRSHPAKRLYGKNFPRFQPPAGWRTVYTNRSWRVSAAPGCSA
jgi:hypothetical protein